MTNAATMLTGSVQESSFVRIASSTALSGDGPHSVSVEGRDLVVVRTSRSLKVFEGRCPHLGALLGEGELDGETLVCRNHRWRFCTKNGQREGGPQCLVSYPALERNGEVLVDVSKFVPGDVTPHVETRSADELPGPRGLPLIGNLHQLDMSALHRVLNDWATEYGPMYQLHMGRARMIAVSSRELAQQVLRARPNKFRRIANVEPVFAEIGIAGVFSAEGAAWVNQRNFAMQVLSQRNLRTFYPTLVTVALRLKKRWERLADANETVDVVEELKRFTVDVTTLLAFGYDVNTLESDGDAIQEKLAFVLPALNRRVFAAVPLWRFIKLPKDRRLDRAMAELRKWLGELVSQARAKLAADPERGSRPANFLEAMITARDESGDVFSDEAIFGNLLTILLAGEDTTAYAISWAVHHLCDHPASVGALRSEANSRFGSADVPADFDTADKLTWASAIANEALRVRHPAPIIVLEANVDTTIGDVRVPPGTRVAVLSQPAAVDPNHFADPEDFRPERWLPGHTGVHEPTKSVPFGSGPRICPGRGLAFLEMKVTLAMIFKSFVVERVTSAHEVREHFEFLVRPAGLLVKLKRISPIAP